MAEPAPLTPDALMRRATRYLARHAASTARLRAVLERAVQRAAGDADLDAAALVEPVIARLQRAGLLDDAAFAQRRTARLAAQGKPATAIVADLRHRHGVDVDGQELKDSLAGLDPLAQALRWARRRGLGPFRLRDRAARRDRDVASLVRIGFAASVAIAVIDGNGLGSDEA